jgi:tRNA(adenine34) deaminase
MGSGPADDSHWMSAALELAREAARRGEVPVGAIVVRAGEVLGRGFNRREQTGDPLAHAELLALREAAQATGHWRLEACTLYVTLEPCPMCAGATVNARLGRLVYGARDPKAGAVETLYQLPTDPRLNHWVEVEGGVRAEECAAALTDFFRALRALGKK